jgi:hypothetical protein
MMQLFPCGSQVGPQDPQPLSIFVIGVFVVSAAAEIGLAIPVVKAKVSAMVKISFFMIEFLLVGATFAQKRKFLKKN